MKDDIAECVNVIRESFCTVVHELGFTEDNAPGFTAFNTTKECLEWQLNHEHRLMCTFENAKKLDCMRMNCN